MYNKIVQATRISHANHENEHIHSIEQGEARNGNYKRFKLGGGQAYDRSSD
jgi:hypothetical protein